MAEQKPPSGQFISNAVRTHRQAPGVPDRARLSDILVKSPQWKRNVLGVDGGAQGKPGPGEAASTDPEKLKTSLLTLIERHWLELVAGAGSRSRREPRPPANLVAENDDIVLQQAERQAKLEARRNDELRRLQQRVMKLEAENALLAKRYEDEVDTRKTELHELRRAYVQFQRESDELLSELENQNRALRINGFD